MQYSLPLKNLLEPIRQPTGLAILASLGIHGIVGLSFENLPMFAKTPKEKNSPVRMVQLTPEQLSRIQPPQRTELTLPLLPPQAQLPSTPTPSLTPGASPTPQGNTSARDLPPPPPVTIPSWPASSTLSTNPNWLPPPPTEEPNWPTIPNWDSNLPSQPEVSIVPNWSPPPLPPPPTGTRSGPQMGGANNWGTQLPPPIPGGNLGGSGQNNNNNDFGRNFNPPSPVPVFPNSPSNGSGTLNPDSGPNTNGNNLPSGNNNAGGRDNNSNRQRPDSPLPGGVNGGFNPLDPNNNSFRISTGPETTPPQSIQPPTPNTATGPTTPPEQRTNLNDNPAITGLIAEMREKQGTRYSALGTTAEWANMRFQSWLNQAQNLSGNSELLPQLKTKDVEYPPEASQIDLKEDPIVAIAVLVAPDGSIAYGPDLIQSSGYDILNAKALESVKNFDGTGQYEAYSYRVRFTANGEPSPEAPATSQETPKENQNNTTGNVSSPADTPGYGEETLPKDNTPETTGSSSPPAAPTTEAPNRGSSGQSPVRAREDGQTPPDAVGEEKPAGDAATAEDQPSPNGAEDAVGEEKPAGDAAAAEDQPSPNGAAGEAVSDSPPPIPAEDAVGEEKPTGDAAAVEDKPSPNDAEGEAVSDSPPPIPAEDAVGEEKPAGDAAAAEDQPRGDASALEFQEGVEDMPY